jgi:PHP domain
MRPTYHSVRMIEPGRQASYTARGYHLLKLEPHLHTLHSDGQDDVPTMLEACREAGYDAVALTDHNTNSGLTEAVDVANSLGLILVPGVEVTTFRGHAVALGVATVPEWRDLEMRGMDHLAAKVRAEGGLLSVAHPAALGSPVCSGCAWEWPIEPASVDLWEVFSAPRPEAEVPLALWRDMLRRGARVAPLAAGDTHSRAAAARQRPATYVYARERSGAGVLEGLRQHRVFASSGEALGLVLERDGGEVALIGEAVAGPGWAPRVPAGTTVETVDTGATQRAVFATRRTARGELEGVTAPIWIDTSQ